MNEISASGKEPTPREMEILKVLWEVGPSSVRDVHRQMNALEPDLAYNTVQTMLRLMETKGLVDHVEQGRTFIYTARFTRDESTQRFLHRVFDGVASDLVMSLLQGETIPSAELDRMQAMIHEARARTNRPSEGEPR